MRPAGRTTCTLVVLAALLMVATACSVDDDAAEPRSTESSTTEPPTTTRPRPPGPAADLSTELTGGDGAFIATAEPDDLDSVGYAEREYAATGTATSYAADGELTQDGRWSFAPDDEADYRTRVLVRAPQQAADVSGTVILEWLNVSSGADAQPEWSSLREEITRAGHVWVGVSAQNIGVEGGPVAVSVEGVPGAEVAGKGLKAIDPERYRDLEHPGDGFSFDIFTQVGRSLLAGAGLDGLEPVRLIAAGESQSAFALVTYVNGVHPLVETFDAYLVHSRGGTGLPLVGPDAYADIASSIGGPPAILRTDQDVPVLVLQTEGDVTSVLNSYAARQPDTDTFRLWEVAGTAHADTNLVGSAAQYFDCDVPINDGPMHVVAKAALRALTTWLDTGEPPPPAPRLDIAPGAQPTIRRDGDGIARGGIRTAPVEVPVATLSGAPGPEPTTICLLLGSTLPFTAERLSELYPSRADYEDRYDEAVDATIDAGYALPADREALVGYADPSAIPG